MLSTLSKDELPLVSQRMKSFSDQWRDHFSILVLIIPDGIVKENKIYGLKAAVLTQVVSTLNHYLQNKYLQNIVKNFISNSPKVVSRLEALKNTSTDAVLL